MADKEKIIVQLASHERLFTKCYHDFLDSKLLNGNEKLMFIVLKRFLDVKADNGEVFPTIETMCNMTGWERKKVMRTIQSLVKKGIVKKIQQGLTKANIYILSDYPAMWNCENLEELKEIAENDGVKPLTPEEHIAELKKMGYIVEIKEKGLDVEPTKAQQQALEKNQYDIINTTINSSNSQEIERYSLEQIYILYDYDVMISDNPYQKNDIDSVMSILHTNLNTTKPTIRIGGEDKPSMVVIGKLMKLTYSGIMYAIGKFKEQTERIKNPTSYMLTLLYNAEEQLSLDLTNQVRHDMAKWNNQE